MSSSDLTRWNRAALSRFRYIDANAATHLEALRIELADRFEQWRALKHEARHDETVTERTARILKQYHVERRDWAWETTRTFARALHILTEYLDAFANEGYLRTATQWPSVRRLAAMVGYVPAPASSATTPLVLVAKSGVASATVERGFAVKHVPAGAPPVIFETLDDIDIAFALNELRLTGWNRNATEFDPAPADDPPPRWPIPKGIKVDAGGLAIFAREEGTTAVPIPAVPVTVAAVTDGTELTFDPFTPPAAVSDGLTFDNALLPVAPSQILVPVLNGSDVVRVSSPRALVTGDVVAWVSGGSTKFAQVIGADARALRLEAARDATIPPDGTILHRAKVMTFAQFTANESQWRLPIIDMPSESFRVTFVRPDGQLHPGLALTEDNTERPNFPGTEREAGFLALTDPDVTRAQQIWFADPPNDAPAATVRASLPARTLEFEGKPPALASGDPVILQTASGYAANRIARIEKDAESYRLVFAADIGTAAVVAVHGAFAATLRPAGHHIDPTPLAGSDLELQLDPDAEWPALLNRGRHLVLESATGAFGAFSARIESITPIEGSTPLRYRIRIDRTPPEGTSRGDLIIRANVVDTGHGETKPVKVLGNGDASATNQRFVIDVDDVSHVRDPAIPGGVRADLRVEVERETYSQIATLRDSEQADPHYVVRITETGTLELEFGDGRHGRRLPSGTNNVLATIRRGSGLAGNLPAAALTDIVKKHPAIESFRQPIAAAGGDERETLNQIRESAPGRIAAMDRAISVADYQQLARRFQGVWHAAAFEQPSPGRSREAVRLAIVPAGGGPLGHLADEIRSYLTTNGLASVDIVIEPFVPLPVEILVRARVDPLRFDPRDVEGRVRAALLAAFDLRRRRPGQPLYRSEVTRVVENTDGVENSDVVLFASAPPAPEPDRVARGDDAGIQAVFPKDNQVIYAANPALITVAATEATL